MRLCLMFNQKCSNSIVSQHVTKATTNLGMKGSGWYAFCQGITFYFFIIWMFVSKYKLHKCVVKSHLIRCSSKEKEWREPEHL